MARASAGPTARRTAIASVPGTRLFAGTSGWAYPTWKPGFYPEGVSAKKFLTFYASQLNAVEVNYTFTKLPTAAVVADWLSRTGPEFRFSFKAPQRITHFSRLLQCEEHVAAFFAALAPVADAGRLGPVLFQLPPNFKANLTRLSDFLATPQFVGGPRLAFEFRHPSWFQEDTYALLRQFDAALCVAESDTLETPAIYTAATHACLRLRRNGGYKRRELAVFAERLAQLADDPAQPREVFVFFKHEDEPTGALNAAAFRKLAARQMNAAKKAGR